jgi:hypothetical protein
MRPRTSPLLAATALLLGAAVAQAAAPVAMQLWRLDCGVIRGKRPEPEKLSIDPKQIEIIGISHYHYHYDHTGQTALFPQARRLMGKGDITALKLPVFPA